MDTLKNDEIRQAVRQRYSRIVDTRQTGCGCAPAVDAGAISQAAGYSPEKVGADAPNESWLRPLGWPD